MEYLFTPQRLAQLEALITEAKKRADRAAQSGFQSGSEQNGHHDEGYQLSLRETSTWDRRVRDLEEIRRNARVIVPVEQDELVQFGNGVEIIYPNGEVMRLIVEGYSFDSSQHSLSLNSPLGRAVLGKKSGEEVSFVVGNRTIPVKIGDISPPSQADEFCSD